MSTSNEVNEVSENAHEAATDTGTESPSRRIPWGAVGVVTLVLTAGFWWWRSGREVTDNARLEGHVHPVSARVAGMVDVVSIEENQRVEKGQLLFELDSADFELALSRARANHAVASADATGARVNVPVETTTATSHLEDIEARVLAATSDVAASEHRAEAARAQLTAARASMRRAEAAAQTADVERRRLEPLLAEQQVSQQEFDRAHSAALSSAAALEEAAAEATAAENGVVIAEEGIKQSRQRLLQAQAALKEARKAPERIEASEAAADAALARTTQAEVAIRRAELDLEYTKVRSPATGVVARKRVEVGQMVSSGQPVLAVVSDEEIWVEANFKENQIEHMRKGQPASIRVDAYPSERLVGYVASLGAATASRFSLLPADNASGNFVKVVQRVPVRIAIERPSDPELVLRPGMSVVVTVHLRRDPVDPGDE